jgi:hypothetical protein
MHPEDPWLEAAGDLQAEFDADTRDVAYDVFVAEATRCRLPDRTGRATIRLRCGLMLEGVLDPRPAERVIDHLILGEATGRLLLIPAAAIVTMSGTRPALHDESGGEGPSLGSWLREAWQADDRLSALTLLGQWVGGRVARVGADHVDIVQDALVVTVAVAAVDAWSRG